MDKLGGDTTVLKDFEAQSRPKQSSRRHLLHNLFDFLAIAASMSMASKNICQLSLSFLQLA